ncbi:MAG: DEAD/DEAH box helicase [Mucilaginibacter sp.]
METNSESIYDTLSERISKSDKFKVYNRLVQNEILGSLNLQGISGINLQVDDIQFLIQSASIFACSTKDEYKQIGYSIGTLLYIYYKEEYPEIIDICSFLLVRLGNFPAHQLLMKKCAITESEKFSEMPFDLQIESASKSVENKVHIGEVELLLTDFQRDLLESLTKGIDSSFSAPTSAGKSFLLILYIINLIKTRDQVNIVYVVPTKALINQVKNDIRESFRRYDIDDVRVLSSTISFEFEDIYTQIKQEKHILILTQERLSNFLSKSELDINLDVLIVDEAQKINDGNRGIILERVIRQTIKRFPLLKVVFSSPLASNPEFFQKYKVSVQKFQTNYSQVHQNVIFLNSNKKLEFLACLGVTQMPILKESTLQKQCPTTNKAKMAFWAFHLGKNQSNILYANGASDTEQLASELCKYLPDVQHEAISIFSEFIKDNIHTDYTLIDCLKKGVVFHYSTMPRELKEKIEELFANESIPVNYLCCTSTLLEGMNLPARNVFIHKPTKGRGTKMGKFDFWNLAGRAGRLLKDFYGNIYCIDVREWGIEGYIPERSIENYTIESATEDSLSTRSADLSAYLQNAKEPFPAKEKDILEQATSTFILDFLEDNANTVERFVSENQMVLNSLDNILKIDGAIKTIATKNVLPKEILRKNSGIDPRFQNDLFLLFHTKIYTYFLPKYPASGTEFYNSLVAIYQIIDDLFLGGTDKNILRHYAVISSQWINEKSIGFLIQERIDYEKKENKFVSVNRCVRSIVDEIERIVTFKYSKYLKCYTDILQHFLLTSGREINVINLSAYLELGAYHPTTLSLLSFGVSRTTAIRLRIIIGNNNLDRAECRKWIDDNMERKKSELPKVCQDDYEKNFE